MGFDHWGPKMKDKLKIAKQSLSEAKGTQFLNPPKFYEEFDVKSKWVRLPDSIEELRLFQPSLVQ